MRSFPIVLLVMTVLVGCSSSGGSKGGTGTVKARDCPSSINQSTSKEEQPLIRQQIGSCTTLVSYGNKTALATLVSYYNGTRQKAELVKILEVYAEAGSDRKQLAHTGSYLYQAYATGSLGVARDSDKAFKYLGLAVNNGEASLQLPYARELSGRGLHKDAMRYYQGIADDTSRSNEERCDAKLNLAWSYFGGDPANENWNIGYYYWQEGLKLAKSPQWGSCLKDNLTSANYSDESARKKFVDQRIGMMSSAQRQVVDEAARDPRKGYKFIASLSFSKPAGAPAAPTPPRTGGSTYLAGWQPWTPIDAPVCQVKAASYPLDWSAVFEFNSTAIWTVDSRNGSSKSQGSAVAVSPTELVTNCHLIENPQQISLRRVGWNLPATVKASDRAGDRCVLQVTRDLPAWVRQGRSYNNVKVGEDVAAIGNPKGLDTSLSRGIVAQKRDRDGLQLIQTDAAISSGSSGGGLFDKAGNLVGITTFTIASGQSLNFAIALDEFCR